MSEPIILIGLGQLGRVFAGGFLRAGHPVIPLNRGDDPAALARLTPAPALALIAVAEADLPAVLTTLPATWRDRVGLLQNELLPRDWAAHDLIEPSVISVWFEKKAGMDAKPLLPSPAFGPHAGLLVAALAAVDLPARSVASAAELEWELVRKNLYILTSNLAGLVAGGTVGALWAGRRELAEAVAADILDLQAHLVGHALDRASLMAGLVEAFAADPGHACAGRSAPARLQRALALGDAAGLALPALRRIAAQQAV